MNYESKPSTHSNFLSLPLSFSFSATKQERNSKPESTQLNSSNQNRAQSIPVQSISNRQDTMPREIFTSRNPKQQTAISPLKKLPRRINRKAEIRITVLRIKLHFLGVRLIAKPSRSSLDFTERENSLPFSVWLPRKITNLSRLCN